MAKKKTGDLIKEARTGKGLTQEALAKKITGLTATDISKAERNEIQLTQSQLKEIAKVTGVTQKSLLDSVPTAKTAGTSASGKKTSSTGKTSSGSGKKTSSTGKTSSAKTSGKTSSTDMKLTEAEKKLVKLYRAADAQAKKEAMAVLEEKKSDLGNMVSSLLNNKAVKDVVSGLLKQ